MAILTKLVYKIKSMPIIYRLSSSAVSPSFASSYPELLDTDIQYTPAHKIFKVSDIKGIDLSYSMFDNYIESFHSTAVLSADEAFDELSPRFNQMQLYRQSLLLSKAVYTEDPNKKYRDIYNTPGCYVIEPVDDANALKLNPALVISNGIDEPLIFINLFSAKPRDIVNGLPNKILNYLFDPS